MSEPFLSEVRIVSFNFAPKGWAMCNGQILPINQNQALFSLLGTQYGGDGRTTFALPNLQGSVPIHRGGSFSQGQIGGEVAHTLTIAEMPAHAHAVHASKGMGTRQSPINNYWAATPTPSYSTSSNTVLSGATAGGSQPHNNWPPYLVLNFVIALAGIFPSRN